MLLVGFPPVPNYCSNSIVVIQFELQSAGPGSERVANQCKGGVYT
jgi:hypothetical protein